MVQHCMSGACSISSSRTTNVATSSQLNSVRTTRPDSLDSDSASNVNHFNLARLRFPVTLNGIPASSCCQNFTLNYSRAHNLLKQSILCGSGCRHAKRPICSFTKLCRSELSLEQSTMLEYCSAKVVSIEKGVSKEQKGVS